MESQTLSQSDKEFLFASNEAKTQVLSEQEMSETKGEFWGTFWGAVGALAAVYQITDDKGWWEFKF